jgi:hypothetical protein
MVSCQPGATPTSFQGIGNPQNEHHHRQQHEHHHRHLPRHKRQRPDRSFLLIKKQRCDFPFHSIPLFNHPSEGKTLESMDMYLVSFCVFIVSFLFLWNVVAIAAAAPFWLRPYTFLHWLIVDLGSRFMEYLGSKAGLVYAFLAEKLGLLLERMLPAMRETFMELIDVSTAVVYWGRAFFHGWAVSLADYQAVQFLIHPTTLFWLSIIGALMMFVAGLGGLWMARADAKNSAVAPSEETHPSTPRRSKIAN